MRPNPTIPTRRAPQPGAHPGLAADWSRPQRRHRVPHLSNGMVAPFTVE
jgi:hypothetical protein